MKKPLKIHWPRVIKLTTFSVFVIMIAIDLAMAWLFVGAMIYPGCQHNPPPLDGPTPETIELHTEDGLTIEAWYYPSQNGGAVITLGGSGGALGNQLPPAMPLLQAGYGVLQIGSRACAKTPPVPVTLGASEVNEAAAGLIFLQSRPEVAPDRIGIFGFSMGGVGAIRTAARHPEIAAVLAEGGYYNLGNDIVEPDDASVSVPRRIFLYTIAGVFWLRTGISPWTISPVDDIARISPRPVLLIYGEHEAGFGRAQAQFESAGEPKELWITPDGSHGQNYLVAPEEYERRVLEFFNQTIGE